MEDADRTRTPAPDVFDAGREVGVALKLTAVVLASLTVVKPLGGLPFIGPLLLTAVAIMQLYLPLWRIDRLRLDYDFLGLHWGSWRHDLRLVLILSAVVFPPYALAHYLYMTQAHTWLVQIGLPNLARFVPTLTFAPRLPDSPAQWLQSTWWLLTLIATHVLGVALPEETFYRGYLQPRLQQRWPPRRCVFGVPLGRAAVIACALFAVGHVLGEWNPLRLGPFFPGLLFAWLRNATGSIVGAIAFHAACNIFGELLYTLYS